MNSSRVGRLLRLTGAVSVSVVATMAVGAAAAPVTSQRASGEAFGFGYYVAGHGQVTRAFDDADAALVVDPRGGRHVLFYGGGATKPFHVNYHSQRRGSTHWTKQTTSLRLTASQHYATNKAGRINHVAAGLSTSGARVYAVASDCKGIFTVGAPATSARLPEFHNSVPQPAAVCSYDANSDGVISGKPPRYRLIGAVPLPKDKVAILVADHEAAATYLFVGHPGDTFKKAGGVLPDLGEYGAEDITRDVKTGELVVIGDGQDINGGFDAWTKKPGKQWTKPYELAKDIETSAKSTTYYENSVAASGGRVFVSAYTVHQVGNGANVVSGPKLIERTAGGQWGAPVAFPHTNPVRDGDLVLLANPDSGHLHAAFGRDPSGKDPGGIMRQALEHGRWTKPADVNRRGQCFPANLAINPAGNLVVGFTC